MQRVTGKRTEGPLLHFNLSERLSLAETGALCC